MGWLGRLFGKKQQLLEPLDLSRIGTDIHSHLIPGIDDGAETIEDSISLLRRFHELGYRKVITSPHVMSDFYKNSPEIILAGLKQVRDALDKEDFDLEIDVAAEYYLDDLFEELLDKDEILSFGGDKRYLLFELPFVGEPANLARAIFNMQLKGYKPVLAHPERYGFWSRDMSKYDELHDKGVLLQINVNSLCGYYGPEALKTSQYLVEKNMISFIGTDCHRLDHLETFAQQSSRSPLLHQLVESGSLRNQSL